MSLYAEMECEENICLKPMQICLPHLNFKNILPYSYKISKSTKQ